MSLPILARSRRTRATPFTARVQANGVKAYTVYNHMLLATAFASVQEDYDHLCQHVQVWDVSCERQVELRGPDAARLMQWMTPRDLSRAVVGQCVYAPIVDERGRMLNDPVVLKLAEDRFWVSIADSDILLWANGLAVGAGMDVAVDEPEVYPVAVQGPKAETLMARVFGEVVREIRFFRFKWLEFRGHPFLVARSGWSKQGGFEIYVDSHELALPLWDALWEAGADLQVGPGCPNLLERIESGLLSYGSDMTRENNPLECGLERFCKLDGPDFIGKAALAKIKQEGIARIVRGLKVAGADLPDCVEAWPLTVDGTYAGGLHTLVWSPRFDSYIGVAMMERAFWDLGQNVTVNVPGGEARTAVVCAVPFEV